VLTLTAKINDTLEELVRERPSQWLWIYRRWPKPGERPRTRRAIEAQALAGEGVRETIIRMLADCKLLLAEKIGTGPRPMLAKAGIEPVDQYAQKEVLPSLADAYASRACAA